MSAYTLHSASSAEVQHLRAHYLRGQAAPLDGMWLAFAQMASAYTIRHGDVVVGFCAVNDDRRVLQFHVVQAWHARAAFALVIGELQLIGAVVATSDAAFVALCMDQQRAVRVTALMYQLDGAPKGASTLPEGSDLRVVPADDLARAVDFAEHTLGADRAWLTYYYTDLVGRGELLGLWLNDEIIATGECRPSPSQRGYADVGMVVSTQHRRQGIATALLGRLIERCDALGLQPICSTESSNLGAQRAIDRAGLVSAHRIIEVDFAPMQGG